MRIFYLKGADNVFYVILGGDAFSMSFARHRQHAELPAAATDRGGADALL